VTATTGSGRSATRPGPQHLRARTRPDRVQARARRSTGRGAACLLLAGATAGWTLAFPAAATVPAGRGHPVDGVVSLAAYWGAAGTPGPDAARYW
jgi:hypothetical protein